MHSQWWTAVLISIQLYATVVSDTPEQHLFIIPKGFDFPPNSQSILKITLRVNTKIHSKVDCFNNGFLTFALLGSTNARSKNHEAFEFYMSFGESSRDMKRQSYYIQFKGKLGTVEVPSMEGSLDVIKIHFIRFGYDKPIIYTVNNNRKFFKTSAPLQKGTQSQYHFDTKNLKKECVKTKIFLLNSVPLELSDDFFKTVDGKVEKKTNLYASNFLVFKMRNVEEDRIVMNIEKKGERTEKQKFSIGFSSNVKRSFTPSNGVPSRVPNVVIYEYKHATQSSSYVPSILLQQNVVEDFRKSRLVVFSAKELKPKEYCAKVGIHPSPSFSVSLQGPEWNEADEEYSEMPGLRNEKGITGTHFLWHFPRSMCSLGERGAFLRLYTIETKHEELLLKGNKKDKVLFAGFTIDDTTLNTIDSLELHPFHVSFYSHNENPDAILRKFPLTWTPYETMAELPHVKPKH